MKERNAESDQTFSLVRVNRHMRYACLCKKKSPKIHDQHTAFVSIRNG